MNVRITVHIVVLSMSRPGAPSTQMRLWEPGPPFVFEIVTFSPTKSAGGSLGEKLLPLVPIS